MERREFRDRSMRYPLRVRALAARVGDRNGPATAKEAVEGWTENLNGRGLYVELPRPLKKGARLLVTLELPLAYSASHLRLKCRCHVVWAGRTNAGRYGAGVAVDEVLFPSSATQ